MNKYIIATLFGIILAFNTASGKKKMKYSNKYIMMKMSDTNDHQFLNNYPIIRIDSNLTMNKIESLKLLPKHSKDSDHFILFYLDKTSQNADTLFFIGKNKRSIMETDLLYVIPSQIGYQLTYYGIRNGNLKKSSVIYETVHFCINHNPGHSAKDENEMRKLSKDSHCIWE